MISQLNRPKIVKKLSIYNVRGGVVFLLHPISKGVSNVGRESIGGTEGNVDQMAEGEDGSGFKAWGMVCL